MGISKLNKGTRFAFSYDKEGVKYFKTAEFVKAFGLDKVFKLRAAHINHGGRYGDSATLIVTAMDDDKAVFGINTPSHMVNLVQEILDSAEFIDEIDSQRAGVQAYEYQDKDGVTRYSFKFVDI